jgi:cell division protein FtsL
LELLTSSSDLQLFNLRFIFSFISIATISTALVTVIVEEKNRVLTAGLQQYLSFQTFAAAFGYR